MVFQHKFSIRNLFFKSWDTRRMYPLCRRRRRWSKVLNNAYFSKFKRLKDSRNFFRISLFEKLKRSGKSFVVPDYFIKSRFTVNNYFLTLVNAKGEVVLWHSSGKEGFFSTSTKKKGYALEKVGRHFSAFVKRKVGDKVCGFIIESKFNYKLRGLLRYLNKEKVFIAYLFWRPSISHNG